MPRISVESVMVGEIGVNCYIVTNMETNACFLVDPGAEAETIIAKVGERRAEAVLLTHGHFDHIGAVDDVCAHYGIPCYIQEADASKLTDPVANVSALFGRPLVQHTQPVLLTGTEKLTLAGMELELMHTPGHTEGGLCCLLPDHQGVLTGDTLFAHGYGRTDFPGGDFGLLFQSLKALFRLAPKRVCYPGHDGPGLVGRNPVGE